jgi:hypothetical protein
MIRDTQPAPEHTPQPSMAFAATPQRAPRNDLERDLFAKLEAARNKQG